MLANSMSDIAIRVENLGKQYKIGRLQKRHDTLRDALADSRLQIANGVSQLANRFSHIGNGKSGMANRASSTANHGKRPADGAMPSAISDSPSADVIWALRDVSFEVKRGEVVGIIGRNGAGKSTLLKILSRITEPTTGAVDLYGRVASLLEVGTGFHPELTGRENIFLNGAILGMRKAEIEKKFDEIVAFAEVEKFIDTPVKRYSSGMYVRLAFAVAAHLEPEILLVDEVLAVGDAAFQEKCLGKMGDVAREGRTVLFVSHNMPAITRLCRRAILIDEGKVLGDGESHQIISAYLGSKLGTTAEREWIESAHAPGSNVVWLHRIAVKNFEGKTSETIDIRTPVEIEMEYEVVRPGHILVPNLHFFTDQGIYAFVSVEHDNAWYRVPRPKGTYVSRVRIPGNFLSEGSLIVGVAITTFTPFNIHFYERDAVAFQVVDSINGNSARGDFAGTMPGAVRPLLPWNTVMMTEDESTG